MNIEETYRALLEAIAVYVMAVARDAASGTTKDSPSAKKDMVAAIRAHTLAVMERALMVGSADHIDDYDAGAEALRGEIEELGR